MCYFAAPRKLKNAVLFVFSLIFYGWGEPRYIALMIVSIFSGFVFALMIEKKQNKKKRIHPHVDICGNKPVISSYI